MFDTVIIGSGPAGLSAALTLKAHDKNLLWIGSKEVSDKVKLAEKISNYPGLIDISGEDFAKAFHAQAEAAGLTVTEHMVNSVLLNGESYALLAGSDYYETKTIILATGVVQSATIPGETDLVGRGVSYCATCDGGLYRGKEIVAISNNVGFEAEVEYLAEIAKKVYYIPLYREVSESLRQQPSVDVVGDLKNPVVKMRSEDGRLRGVTLKDGTEIAADGCFVLRDSMSMATLLPDLKVEGGHIEVDRGMRTNLPGVFAAGDCTGRPYQYAKAVGEGNVAAHSVIAYLHEKGGAAESR